MSSKKVHIASRIQDDLGGGVKRYRVIMENEGYKEIYL